MSKHYSAFSLTHLILDLALSFRADVSSFIKTNGLSYLRQDAGKLLLVSHPHSFMEYLLWVDMSPKIRCRALHCLILEFPSHLQPCYYPLEPPHSSCHRLIKIHIVGVLLPKFFVSCQSKWEIPRPNPTQICRNYPCKMNLLSEAILYIKQGLRRFLPHT